MSHPTITFLDLTADEQEHARNALHFLRVKLGSWKAVTRLLHFEHMTVMQAANGTRTVTASMAFRIAKTLNVSVDAIVSGRFPEPGTCPRCGYLDSRRAVAAARKAVKAAQPDVEKTLARGRESNGGGGHECH